MKTDQHSTPLTWFSQLWAQAMSPRSLAVVDQSFVSGTNFLTTVIIGQACDAASLGVYSLGFAVLVVLLSIQDAFVSLPYTIYGNQCQRHRQMEYAGSSWIFFLIFAALCASLVTAGGLLLIWSSYSTFGGVVLVFAAALPILMLREFGRRMAFAHLDVWLALRIDAIVTALQLAALLLLARTGHLTPLAAFVVMGSACGVAGAYWWWQARRRVVVEPDRIRSDFQRNWVFGRWIAAAQAGHNLQWYVLHWLLAVFVGAAATGRISACMSLVLLSNPLLIGLGNVLETQVARALPQHGPAGVRRAVLHTALLLGTLMSAFAVGIVIFGDDLLSFLYGGDFAAYANVASVLAFALVFGSLGSAADYGLRALDKTPLTFAAVYCGLTVTLIVAGFSISQLGILGCAYGLLAGSVAGAVVRLSSVLILTRDRAAIPVEHPVPAS
jgi:O-antigen/teichoic acid export membrane protein